MTKNKEGFTLFEVLIASILTTIVFAIAGMVIVRLTKASNELSKNQEINSEATIIDSSIKIMVNNVNSDKSISITYDEENNKICDSTDSDIIYLLIDNSNKELIIGNDTIVYDHLDSVDLTVSKRLISVLLTFDNGKKKNYSYLFVRGIN